jgi:RNA polymerase sigma factor (sigma-70 family)
VWTVGIRAGHEFERSPRPRGRLSAAPTDDQLVERCREGDQDAFAAVVARYETMLTRHCARIVGPSAAEDAVQEAFVAAWVAFGSGVDVHDLKPWLFQIARRKAFKTRDPRDVAELSDSVPGARSSEEEATGSAQARAVLAAVAALPATQRDALVGSALHGRSGLQLARQLGTTAPNVRQLVFRAREQVRLAAAACLAPPLALLRLLRHQGAGQAATAPGSMAAATAVKAGVALIIVAAAGTAAGVQLSQPASPPPPSHHVRNTAGNTAARTRAATGGVTPRQLGRFGTVGVAPINGPARRRTGARWHGGSTSTVATLRRNSTPSALQADVQAGAHDGSGGAQTGAAAGAVTLAKPLLGSTKGVVHSVAPSATGALTTLPATTSKLTSTLVGPAVGQATQTVVSAGGAAVQGATGAVTGAVAPVGATAATQLAPTVGAVTGAATATAQSTVNTVVGTLRIGSN